MLKQKLKITNAPDLAIILGSGINLNFKNQELISQVNYSEISELPNISVSGHKGIISYLKIKNKNILVFAGRFHLYEGYSVTEIQSLVNIINNLNIKNLLLTNAAGGISPNLKVGDLMLIKQIKNLQIINSDDLLDNLKNSININSKLNQQILQNFPEIKIGNYMAVLGPNYETEAEINFFNKLNCSAVGMSTYLEAKFAIENNINISAISIITNSWFNKEIPTHQEVLNNSQNSSQKISNLIENINIKCI